MSAGLLGNSLLLVGLTTALGLAWALPFALALQVIGPGWRKVLVGGALATLALPGFFVAGTWMEWVGFAGAWRVGTGGWTERWLPLICSAWVLSLLFWPIPALLIGAAWERWDGRVLEVWPELRGTRLVREVLWPIARGAWVFPVVVMAILVLGQFSVPALFQARVWPAEVWVEYSTRFDEWAAVRKSVLPGGVLLGLLLWPKRRPPSWPVGGRGGIEAASLRGRLGPWLCSGSVAAALLLLGVALALPIGAALTDRRTWTELVPAAEAAWPAVGRSFGYAAGTATCVMVAGAWLAGRRWAALSILPLIFPGVLVGIALARVFALPGVAVIRGSAVVVVAALAVRYLFIGWYATERGWRGLEPAFWDLARLEGMGRWTRWRHLVWPMRGPTLRGAWLVAYLLCLWDIETLILVVPPGGDSLSLMIFNLLHYGHNAQVTALCLLLGGLALVPVLLGGAVPLALGWGTAAAVSAERRGKP